MPLLPHRYTLLCMLGLALIGLGAWMVYPPAAPLVVGVVLLFTGVRGSALPGQ